jgi:type I restriction-modification system DNA methylase subunit
MSLDGIAQRLSYYGAPRRGVRSLRGTPTADHVRYLDLMSRDLPRPDAVVELKGEPLAYAVDATQPKYADIVSLQRSLMFRADAPYLVTLEPGQLQVFSLNPDNLRAEAPAAQLIVQQSSPEARTTFQRLFHEPESAEETAHGRAVHRRLFELLTETVDELVALGLSQNDALSLSGRAMFSRFLVDRGILSESDWKTVSSRAKRSEEFFADSRNSAATCRWLEQTFNGDFLPLSFTPTQDAFSRFPQRVFDNLSDIMHCRRGQQLYFNWDNIDLSNVPAGLLSQVYEHQAERLNPYSRHSAGVYYTPRRVAEFMVKEVFASIRKTRPEDARKVRVLDPAVGGGVFLVAMLRELVGEHWRYMGHPPTSRQIRQILNSQLVGFDISEPALRLTSLSLYLTALEVDSNPSPLSELKFEPLRGRVLFDVKEAEAVTEGAVLGSLRRLPEHRSQYDVVIGNPPWTSVNASTARLIENEMNIALAEHLPSTAAKPNVRLPDNVPDIAFAWYSTVWAKPDAWIVLALHARLLFKQSRHGIAARQHLLQQVEVTGILNGSELRATTVWPEMTAPFCILFARNRKPKQHSAFYFVSPALETRINGQGRFRIDPEAAHPITNEVLHRKPTLLKSLFRGTALDVALLDRINETVPISLSAYWQKFGLAAGQGYQIGISCREDASSLKGLPDLASSTVTEVEIDMRRLPRFSRDRIHRVRNPNIYLAPVVLVRKSPPSPTQGDLSRPSAIAFDQIAYSESFYGWSTANHDSSTDLAKYLYLLLNSHLFNWYSLQTSGEFGVERDSIQKRDIDTFRVVELEQLKDSQLRKLKDVYRKHVETPSDTQALNQFVYEVYGLSDWDRQVVADTLDVRLPYRSTVSNAERAPSEAEVEYFRTTLEKIVSTTTMTTVGVQMLGSLGDSPWEMISIAPANTKLVDSKSVRQHLQLANRTGASRVLVRFSNPPRMVIGLLRQYRYWTPTRARLLALEIAQSRNNPWD